MTETGHRLTIWGDQIPYNTGRSKLDVMALPRRPLFGPAVFLRFAKVIGKDFIDDADAVNAATYIYEIKKGEAKTTFDDEPYLTPYPVPGSDRAIVVVPGGGYAIKSAGSEDAKVAKFLNEAGISAFVLWYRVNPYRAPVPWLDLQRAVRYLRHHAGAYGLDPAKIGVLGFSAGGHACASLITLLRGAPVDDPGYAQDAIDEANDGVALAGLIYPALDLTYNPGILFALAEPEQVRDAKTRRALIERTCPTHYVQAGDPPQFLCYGTKDALVDPRGVLAYKAKLDEKGVANRLLAIEGARHGFGACSGLLSSLIGGNCAHWGAEFAQWANGVFG